MSRYCMSCMEKVPTGEEICPHCGAQTRIKAQTHLLRPGTMLDGRYLVGKALGQGGFGITYIGRDTLLDLRVAIKEYFPNGCSLRNHERSNTVAISDTSQDGFFQNGKEKFLREAKILAKFCDDPGIVGVRDFFESNGTAYIVMEYLEGITLKDYITERGALPTEGALELLHPVITALGKVHEQGVIHRDISPDNIFLLPDGRPKLLDFGAAREIADGKSMSVLLKVGYAPEEQYRRKGEQGPWTDVYALCATIYFCLTGQAPEESIERVWSGDSDFVRPSEAGSDILPSQEAALMRGLAVKGEDRWQSMAELEAALYPDPRFQTLSGFTLGDAGARTRVEPARSRTPAPEEHRPAKKRVTEAQPRPAREREGRRPTPTREPEERPRKPKKQDRKNLVLIGVLTVSCLILLFSAFMLIRELRGSSPTPRASAEPKGGEDGVASVEFVAAAPAAATPTIQQVRIYKDGQEVTQDSGFTLTMGQGSVTLTAKAYSNMPNENLHFSWSTSDSSSLTLTPSEDTASCVCTIVRPSGGITVSVSCYGQVYTVPVYLVSG